MLAIKRLVQAAVRFVEHGLNMGVTTGLRIVAPVLILAYLYRLVSGPVTAACKSLAVLIGNAIGIPPALAGSSWACLILALVILALLGGLYYAPPGRFAIRWLDRQLCHIALYRSLRNLVKLPAASEPEHGPGGTPEGRVVWVWQPGGWAPGIVRDETRDDSTGIVMLTVMFLAVPLPTSWTIRRVNAAWTSDAGASASAWTAWNEKGGGPLPEGAKEAPPHPPVF
jgi:uncharacterized membrane protein